MRTKVINLFAGPSSGKSSIAYSLTGFLKSKGYDAELASERAKDLVWEERFKELKENQLLITAEQTRRIQRLIGKVEYVITDSPILLGAIYAPNGYYPSYKTLLYEIFESFHNENFFIKRKKKYNPIGRTQTEEEAKTIDGKILDLLDGRYNYLTIDGTETAHEQIFQLIK